MYKNSTESEKSEEKLSISNSNEQNNAKSNFNLNSKPFQYSVENLTKNQLDQINEIVKANKNK